jgi:hypothetical protein
MFIILWAAYIAYEGSKDFSTYSVGEAFTFDGLEIMLGAEMQWTVMGSRGNNYENEDVVKIPIIVKNLKDDEHGLNMFFYGVSGSKGTKVHALTVSKDDINTAGGIESGGIKEAYIYIRYDGDAEYIIVFNKPLGEKAIVVVPVKR